MSALAAVPERTIDASLQPFVDRLTRLSFVHSAVIEEGAHAIDPHRDGTIKLATPAGQFVASFVVVESPVIRSRLGDVFAAAAAHSNLIVMTQCVGPAVGDMLEQRAINFVDLEGNCYVTVGTRYVARRQAVARSRPAASEESSIPSQVYQRYNGFMLGFWTMLLSLDAFASRYDQFRLHVHDLMAELGLAWRLPDKQADYVQASDRCEQLVQQLERVGVNMAEFFLFGTDTLHVLIDPASDTSGVSFERMRTVAQRHALHPELLESEVERNWQAEGDEQHFYERVVARAYRIAAIALESCLPNRASCFVSVPSGEPFRSYYASYYRPALTLAGYEALRAWDGASSEAYVALLRELIGHCGATLADLSAAEGGDTPHANVLHEVGVSMGVGTTTYLLRDARECKLPSNLASLPVSTYDPSENGWPDEHALGLAMRIRELEHARSQLPTPE